MNIQTAAWDDYPAIADLISRENRLPTGQCLHSSLDDEQDSLLLEIEKWHNLGEITFVVAIENEHLQAVMGSEFDESLGRSWLWGPHISDLPWPETADHLFAALRQVLPVSIHQFDAYLNVKNRRALDFYQSQGFSHSQLRPWSVPDVLISPVLIFLSYKSCYNSLPIYANLTPKS